MKPIEKYKYWILLSDYDLETVQVLIDGQRWVYVAMVCQQAVERQLKGMYVYHVQKEAPKSHNLGFLFETLTASEHFMQTTNAAQMAAKNEWQDFMVDLMFYYMSDYPFSYKNISARFITGQTAQELYAKTKQCVSWLRSLQPTPPRASVTEFYDGAQ